MRITQTMISSDVLTGIEANGSQLDQMMTQLASGKAFTQPSDDPVGVAQYLQLTSLSSQYDQYYANMQNGDSWLTTSDSAMQSGNNVLQSANELAIQGANGTYSAVQRSEMNSQVQSLVDQMLSIANTTLNGQYVFSGTQTNVPPFTLAHGTDTISAAPDANGTSLTTVPATVQLFDTKQTGSNTASGNPSAYDVVPGTLQIAGLAEGTDYTVDYKNGTVTFNTAAAVAQAASAGGISLQYDWVQRSEKDLSGTINRQTQQGTTAQVNITADQAFGSKSQTNVFDSLIDLMQGLHTNDQTQIQSSMSEVQDSLTQLVKAQTTAGSKENLLQGTETQNRASALQVTTASTNLDSIDYAKVATQYQNLQTVYQAAIQVGAKIIQPTLASFL